MGNRLVDHLRERGRTASAGFVARWLRPLPAARWRQAVVLLKTRPVGRIALALAGAFACGVVIGVGVATLIGPRDSDGTVIAAAAGQAGSAQQRVERASYAVPVRVRTEGEKPTPSVAEAPPTPKPAEPRNAAPSTAADASATQPAPAAAVALAPDTPPVAEAKAPLPAVTEPLVKAPIAAATDTPARVQVPLADVAPAAAPEPAAGPAAKPAAEPKSAGDATAGAPSPATPETQPDTAAQATPSTPAASVTPTAAAPTADPAPAAAPPAAASADTGDAKAHKDTAPTADSVAPPAAAAGQQLALLPPSLPDPEVHAPAEGAQTPDRPVVQTPAPGEKKLQLASLPMLHGDAPWIRNAVKLPPTPRNVAIAIIIDDMGIDQKRSKLAIGLPAPLTMSFIPYGYHLHALTAAARAAGHEIMLHVPMEPLDPEIDPGPHALRTTLSVAENRKRLDWDFSRLDGYVGLNNHMGSKFTAWKPGMEMVMDEVRKRGLLFVDSFTSNESVGFHLARADRLPSAARDIFIDHAINRAAIEHSLQELEHIARRRGYAVGIAHPHDLSREILAKWIPEAKARGVSFVPISYIVRREFKSG